ncbi:MAG: TauD/TfdA family dioxygenase [Pseudomonadota bacterium]
MPMASEDHVKVVGTQTEMLDRVVDDESAWIGETAFPSDGRVVLDTACLDELRAAIETLRANPLPLLALDPDDFALDSCRAAMANAKRILDVGVGFVIVDRLPLDEMSQEEGEACYWLLGSMIARPVAQKWDGLMKYDVRDTGVKPEAGNGVRGSITNVGQAYHTDNAFDMAPDYVGLMCLRPSKEGGVSGLVSFQTVHNELLKRDPALLARLYEPFYFDRQREHAEQDPLVSQTPVFRLIDDRLSVRFSDRLVEQAYEMLDKPLDEKGRAALDAMLDIINAPGMDKEFSFERGQIQIVNNRRLGHRRTAFTDWPEPERKRHLVRLWFRNNGRPFYAG